MATTLALIVGLMVWVAGYQLLGYLVFRDRGKEWDVMEDMINEGAQTSCLVLVSGIVAVVLGVVVWVAADG